MINFQSRTLYHGDNLGFLRGMNSETIDLIATDPPFNKNRDFHATPDSLAAGARFQDRWSWERDVHQDWVDQITDDYPRLMEAIESARFAHSDGMGAFMCFMAVRLLEMWRVLKPTGSLYLHCDPTASHYLKAVLDAIFGRKNFRNEIIWQRASGRAKGSQFAARTFGTDTDSILFYSRSDKYIFHSAYVPLNDQEIDEKFPHKDNKGRYNTTVPIFRQPSMGARPNLCYEYNGVRNPHPAGWRVSKEKLREMDARGEIIWRDGKRPLRKSYLQNYRGKPLGSLWTDIPNVTGSKERTGFPSQKPLALYRRIIAASSNEGGMVLDPFCGCATTPVAAEQLKRQWVGMDIWDGAEQQVKTRLRKEWLFTPADSAKVMFPHIVHIMTEPPTRTDDAQPAAPFLRVKQAHEPPGPKMSRAEIYAHLLEQHGARCQGCYREFDDPRYLQLDHNVPRSDGGLNHISNRILLCGPCNRLKSNIYTLSGLRRQNKKLGYMRG
ncbi:MAG: DNA methyltransferase [Chloroflexi bacterium]|nr:DNA methyltransferase [Chloroflexota bacterium]